MNNTNEKPVNTEHVYSEIRKRILKLELEPGQKISENQMAEEYGVSRSIIHSAFVRLNQQGLLTVYPQRGTYVTTIDLKFIGDLLVLRTAVEKESVYELFEQVDEQNRLELIRQLEENLDKQEAYRGADIYDLNFQKLDSEFHKLIISSVGRYRLVEILGDLMLHIVRWRNFDMAFDKRMPNLINQHRKIVETMKTGDFFQVQKAIAEHLETISDIRVRAIETYPQYFMEK